MICFVLQLGVVMVPWVADVFRVISMNMTQWGIVMGLSIAPIPMIELQKWINRHQKME
jgi:Ca2+-transporting ATPase